MFGKKKKTVDFDKTGKTAVLRCSICTREKVAGFKDNSTFEKENLTEVTDQIASDLASFIKDNLEFD